MGTATKETKRANGTRGHWEGARAYCVGRRHLSHNLMMNRNHLCEALGEEHSRKKKQARNMESKRRSVGLGSHEAVGRVELSTSCLPSHPFHHPLTPFLSSSPPLPKPTGFLSVSPPQSVPSKPIDFRKSRMWCFFESLALGIEPVLFPFCVENIELP